MFARSRLVRATAVSAVTATALMALAACGSTKTGYGDATISGFGVASVSGSFGKTPSLTWHGLPAYPAKTEVKTLTPGTGKAVGSQSVDLRIYIADAESDVNRAATDCASASASSAPSGSPSATTAPAGRAKVPSSPASAASAASADGSAPVSPVSSPSAAASSAVPTPTPIPVPTCPPVSWPLKGTWAYGTGATSKPVTIQAQSGTIWDSLLKGAKVGARIEALAGSNLVFPESSSAPAGDPQLGIGSKDPLLLVVDVVRITPIPSDSKAHRAKPGTMPKVLTNAKGNPTGFDWKGVTKPSPTTPVQVETLKKGTGAVVKSTDTVTVNYFGETYKATSPFDQSYTKKPFTTALSGVVKGWAIGLTGQRVGSRVLIQIPPYYGYGSSAQSGIPANSTLWFVVDIQSAKKGS